MNWLLTLWYRRLRGIDLTILWPACKQQAIDMDHAKAAFACHALHDRAWLILGEEEVCQIIDGLT